jgi:glycerophosphoryl diester phosphodiesterase
MRCIFSFICLIMIISCKTIKPKITFAENPVVAHRGAWKANGFPENSIASLKEAIKLGCCGSEFDIRMTVDNFLVINHDPHFNKLLIEKTTYAELQKFELSNGEKLPTLRAYILAGLENNKNTQLVCEIKPSEMGTARAEEIVKKVLATIKELKADRMVTYISFDYNMLKTIHQINPKATTQYLNGDKSPEAIKTDGLTGLDYHFNIFTKNEKWIAEAKNLGLTLNAWTVNDTKMMDFFIENQFDFITTNEPEILLERYKK